MTSPNAASVIAVERVRIPRARWMSLNEALEHIEIADDCDRLAARQKLREAVAGKTLPVRWIDEGDEHDVPPDDTIFWKKATMRMDHGGEILYEATDAVIFESSDTIRIERTEMPPRYRGLLVSRHVLQSLWPALSTTELPEVKQTVALPVGKPAIREKARELYAKMRGNPPNTDIAGRLIKKSLPNAKLSRIREVLNENEFERQRRKAGRPEKKKSCQ